MKLKDFDFVNNYEKILVEQFCFSNTKKKYILGINKLSKSVQKYIQIDGIIDDFTRVQRSRKKDIVNLEDIPNDSIILWTSQGSPLEVKNKLDSLGYNNISYHSFYKYSGFDLIAPDFIVDFKDDFIQNRTKYIEVYNLLKDEKSKTIFKKLLNFKITLDFDFMEGFTNNFKEQYFDKELIPYQKNIIFLDGGGYVGDTLPNIIAYYPDFKKIYMIEPSKLHIDIAKRNFNDYKNIKFVQCGLSNKKQYIKDTNSTNICDHNYQAQFLDTIDNIIEDKIDFIKLDIEGAEQDAIEGAKDTIRKYRPILAICIYHKASDWYMIPQKVLKIDPNYEIYLRHYMEGIYETVMYFIPKKEKIV